MSKRDDLELAPGLFINDTAGVFKTKDDANKKITATVMQPVKPVNPAIEEQKVPEITTPKNLSLMQLCILSSELGEQINEVDTVLSAMEDPNCCCSVRVGLENSAVCVFVRDCVAKEVLTKVKEDVTNRLNDTLSKIKLGEFS